MAITTTTTATGSTTNLSFVRLPSLPHNTPIPSILPFPNSNSNSNSNSPHHHHHSSRHLQVRKLLAATWDRLCSLPVLPLTAAAFPFFLDPKDALAVGGEFGILEGRTVALIHPIVMSGLFVYTLWAGYLGWQWRRVRTIQDEINDLKKQLKPSTPTPVTVTPGGGGSGSGAPEAAAPSSPPSPVELKIQQLMEERKELIKGGFRDRHFNAGSILLGFGVFESVGGGVNTWFRTGKLFPGPHLFAGAAITVLWAAAAALVPLMQKGSETARNLHIALNVLNVLLFIWQIPTGIDIVFKVFEFTKWP